VPTSGGLTLTAVNNWMGQTSKGMKSTVVHFLPLELLAFLEFVPFLFVNREDTPHTFWMATVGLINLLHTFEVALEAKDSHTLTKLLDKLKNESLKDVLLYTSDDPTNRDLAEVDLFTLNDERFEPVAPLITKRNPKYLNEIIACLKFSMRYHLLDFEENDNFEKTARIEFREPPLMIYSNVDGSWRAEYNQALADIEIDQTGVGKFYIKPYDANSCVLQIEPNEISTSLQADTSMTSSKGVKRGSEEKEVEKSKVSKGLTDEEIREGYEAARILCEVASQESQIIPGIPVPKFASTPRPRRETPPPPPPPPPPSKNYTKDESSFAPPSNDDTSLDESLMSNPSRGKRTCREPEGVPVQLHFHLPVGVNKFTIINPSRNTNEWKINLS
jgi:hypothetical protein